MLGLCLMSFPFAALLALRANISLMARLMATFVASGGGALPAFRGVFRSLERCVGPRPAVHNLVSPRRVVARRIMWPAAMVRLAFANGEEEDSVHNSMSDLSLKGMMPELQSVMKMIMEQEALLSDVQNDLAAVAKERSALEECLWQPDRDDWARLDAAMTMILDSVSELRDDKQYILDVLRGFLNNVEHAALQDDSLLRGVKMELQSFQVLIIHREKELAKRRAIVKEAHRLGIDMLLRHPRWKARHEAAFERMRCAILEVNACLHEDKKYAMDVLRCFRKRISLLEEEVGKKKLQVCFSRTSSVPMVSWLRTYSFPARLFVPDACSNGMLLCAWSAFDACAYLRNA